MLDMCAPSNRQLQSLPVAFPLVKNANPHADRSWSRRSIGKPPLMIFDLLVMLLLLCGGGHVL